MYSTGGIQLISADKFQISAGAFRRGKSGTEWWLQLLRTGVLDFRMYFIDSEMCEGGLGWPWGLQQGCEAVQLPPCFFPNISLQKKIL